MIRMNKHCMQSSFSYQRFSWNRGTRELEHGLLKMLSSDRSSSDDTLSALCVHWRDVVHIMSPFSRSPKLWGRFRNLKLIISLLYRSPVFNAHFQFKAIHWANTITYKPRWWAWNFRLIFISCWRRLRRENRRCYILYRLMVISSKEGLNVVKCMFEASSQSSCYVWEHTWRGAGGGSCAGTSGWGPDGGGPPGGAAWCWGPGGKPWYGAGPPWVGFTGVGWLP